jgi:AraC-like DNA-binding protein
LSFRSKVESSYTTPSPVLAFVLSGLEFKEWPGVRIDAGATGCFLHPQGLPIHFSFNEQRENYVILFDSDSIRHGAAPDRVEIRYEGEWFWVPMFAPIDAALLPGWRLELNRIRTDFLMTTARDRLHAKLGVLNMLRQMINKTASPIVISPAERLKTLIDSDLSESHSMNELCAACDYSPAHLRVLFTQEFGVTPKQYRVQRRMAEAMAWITGSRQPVKEIAWRLGFAQASHFSAAFKAVHGLSPRQAILRFRGIGA